MDIITHKMMTVYAVQCTRNLLFIIDFFSVCFMKSKLTRSVSTYILIALLSGILAFLLYNATFSRPAKTYDTESDAATVRLLSSNLENRLQAAGSILNVTSQLPQVRNVPYAHLLNETSSTLHGIPQDADIEKRTVAQHILSNHKDFQIIVFIMPNGDIYFDEPYSRQEMSTLTNLGFRDYFQGALRTNDTFLGNVNASASSGQRQALIAVPVYSLEDNSTLAGVWTGGLDFDVLNSELQSLHLAEGKRVVYVDHNGKKIADSANSTEPEVSFANLTSFKKAIAGESGSIAERVGDENMTVTYAPVEAFHNTWAVLLIETG